jgi:hypothetical protein
MMTGIGTPSNHKSAPLPNPMTRLLFKELAEQRTGKIFVPEQGDGEAHEYQGVPLERRRHGSCPQSGSLLDEIVLVDFPHLVDVLDPDADPMPDHQRGELLSVDQHDALGDAGDEIVGGAGKV